MPLKKRKPIGQIQSKTKKGKLERSQQTPEEREERLLQLRLRASTSRSSELSEQREARLQDKKSRATLSRSTENSEQREARLQDLRNRATLSRLEETSEQRETRLQDLRNRATSSRLTETSEQRETRLQDKRNRENSLRSSETSVQREARLREARANVRHSRAMQYEGLAFEGFRYDPSKNYLQNTSVTIGKMNSVCQYCHAKRFTKESPGMCCNIGKIKLNQLEPPPQDLLNYTTGNSSDSKHFLNNIRRYNSIFQMTSFGATSVIVQPGFKSTFTVQGQVYHKAGSLLPMSDQPAKFLQLYFTGNEQKETEQRSTITTGTKSDIVLTLQRMFHTHNSLIKLFKTALERMPTDEYKIIIRADKRPVGEHERRFNAPQSDEVAVVIAGDEFDKRDIIIQKRSHSLQRIFETHRSYDSLQYPVIFPYGEDGYHFNLKQINPETSEPTNKKVSAKDFYAYRIMIRDIEYSHILNCRYLFQQFIVDMYAKIESERLLYIRLNQRKLRAEEYIHLRDAVVNDGNLENLGALVILPTSFTGSPRHLHEYTQDAMTYVRTYGRPDLFITFTCNPAWEEIKEMLIDDQTPSERHDLIARVFKQKQLKFIEIITKGHIFGTTRCWMYTIEWQKRGLPHSHNLIWLATKIHSNQIDEVISAELPNPTQDPQLFAIITKNMIHGPCGNINPKSPCMKDGKCTKNYPKKLLKETQTGLDSYPLYRRRAPEDGGFTAKIKTRCKTEIEIDNRWVVPFSPLLSKIFQAHINVEYCNSVKSIKYVCKYINKGSDMAVFGVSNEKSNDEVARYQLGRYISSNEAVWRILGFSIHERFPTVFHLSIHLENGQRVYFTPENLPRVVEQPPNTTLTAFFELCNQDPFARTLLYNEVPKFYTWDATRKVFKKRKIGQPVPGHDIVSSEALGRVYTVHPNNAECYFLRILLHTVRGPRSFVHLRTVSDEVCQTFREACQKLGLLEGDNHWDKTLQEAELFSPAKQIRNLFAIILTACSPSHPNTLWEKYKEPLSEDILAQAKRDNPTVYIKFTPEIFNKSLILLEDKCVAMINKTLKQLGLPSPVRDQQDILTADYLRETTYNIQDLAAYVADKEPMLNQDQRIAYETIMEQVIKQKGGIIFLDAPGGTGKTFLNNLILAKIRSKGEIALAIASSGIAATLMEGGRTAHSALKLPLNIAHQENPSCKIGKRSGIARVLKLCSLIIWDECTMAHKKSLEALDFTLKDLRGQNKLMGGALILLCGDFRQTLPVIPKSTPADEIYACLKNSFFWSNVQTLTLHQNMRVHLGDETAHIFSNNLLEMGEGKLKAMPSGKIKLSSDFCNLLSSVEELINSVYPSVIRNYKNINWLRERAILAPKNEDVHDINNKILAKVPGQVKEYKSIDTVVDTDEAVNFPPEFLNSLDPAGLPPHRLSLKVGAPIILLRNLDPPNLCNGTRLCVKKMLDNVIEATIITGKGEGEAVFIPRIPLIPTDLPFNFKRLQLPIRLAFSVTINKSQGQSIKYCGVDLRSPCFSHGQLYVACSRVGSPSNLFILAPENETKNVVYTQVLS